MLRLRHGLRLEYRQEGARAPTAPTITPILVGESTLGEYEVTLDWTPSNKMGPGDVYVTYWSFDGGTESTLTDTPWPSTTALFSDSSNGPGEYCFRVVPVNTVGEGPSSNTVCFTLPGESEMASYLLRNGGSRILLNAGGAILING